MRFFLYLSIITISFYLILPDRVFSDDDPAKVLVIYNLDYPDENGEVFLTFDSLPLNTSDQKRWQMRDNWPFDNMSVTVTYFDENHTIWCCHIFYCTLNGHLMYDPNDPTFLEEHPNFIRNSLCGSLILIFIALIIIIVRSRKNRFDSDKLTTEST